MTRRELLSSITSREMAEWRAYYRLEPFGEHRADLRAGVVASTIANVNRKRGSKPLKPQDFMLFIPKAQRAASLSEDIKSAFKRWESNGSNGRRNGLHRGRGQRKSAEKVAQSGKP